MPCRPHLPAIPNIMMPDPTQSVDFACGDSFLAFVLEAVHLFLGGIVLSEDDPEDNCGDEGCDGETGWIRVSEVWGY